MSQKDIYVDPDATGGGTGVDWTNAYTSLNAAEAAEQADLVTLTTNLVFHLRSSGGTKDTIATIFDGSTTNVTYDIKIISEDNHQGKWDTSIYILQVADSNVLSIYDGFITIDGVQLELSSMTSNFQAALTIDNLSSGMITTLKKVICKGANDAVSRERLFNALNGRTIIAYNCLFWNVNINPPHEANTLFHNGGSTITFYNCNFNGGYNTVYLPYGTTTAINCIMANAANAVMSGAAGWTNSDYNASDKVVTTGGIHDIESATFYFMDEVIGDFHLTADDSSGVKNGGVDDPSSGLYNDDIDGDVRVSPWDIGIDEYITGIVFTNWYYNKFIGGM